MLKQILIIMKCIVAFTSCLALLIDVILKDYRGTTNGLQGVSRRSIFKKVVYQHF